MPERESIVLRPAHAWQCPECGVTNYVDDNGAEITPEEAEETRIELGLPEGTEIEAIRPPEAVECAECHKCFDVWIDAIDDEAD